MGCGWVSTCTIATNDLGQLVGHEFFNVQCKIEKVLVNRYCARSAWSFRCDEVNITSSSVLYFCCCLLSAGRVFALIQFEGKNKKSFLDSLSSDQILRSLSIISSYFAPSTASMSFMVEIPSNGSSWLKSQRSLTIKTTRARPARASG